LQRVLLFALFLLWNHGEIMDFLVTVHKETTIEQREENSTDLQVITRV